VNAVLGDFGGRINMNLREDKGWSYGAQSLIWRARAPGRS
jgi:zinc protease